MNASTGDLLPHAGRPKVRWKNGGGITSPVTGEPAGGGLEDFVWRVSVAEVTADGPFSSFPGVDRAIVVIDGPGMVLTVGGEDHLVAPGEPFCFSGDGPTAARLVGGTTVDLNVMTRRSSATATLETRPAGPVVVRRGEEVLVFAAWGSLTVTTASPDDVTSLGRLDAARWAGPVRVETSGRSAIIVIRPGGGPPERG